MILIINICKEKLHYFEFVRPIEDILKNNGINSYVKSYQEVNKKDLDDCDKVIICGTSLYDNEFIKNIGQFKWIIDFRKPVLGICGGMQIIGKVFGGELKKKTEENKGFLKKKTEIGFFKENFKENFLGIIEEQEVYHLHNYYCIFSKEFYEYTNSSIPQAVKHKEKEIYGALFHPEVRQKHLIVNFCSLVYKTKPFKKRFYPKKTLK